MNNFIVKFEHALWVELTRNKTIDGLGAPYTITSNSSEIEITRTFLDLKRASLVKERTAWEQFAKPTSDIKAILGISKSNPSYELRVQYVGTDGDSPRGKFRRLFGRRLYAILFPLIAPTNSAIATYWDNFGKLGALDDFENNKAILSIIDNYVKLIDDILALTAGLSRFEDETGTTNTPNTPNIPTLIPTARTIVPVAFNFIDFKLVEVPLLNSILSSVNALIQSKTNEFFDPTREYKTVANFGEGNQYLIEAWREGPTSSSVQLKLTTPLDSTINEFDIASIFREVANSVFDSIQIELSPTIDNTPYLRPANVDGRVHLTNQQVNEATITSLGLVTGSVGVIAGSSVSYEDRVFNQWYTADFNASELNIDFTDYKNFVHFGSAVARLASFKNKLTSIELLGTSASLSSSNVSERRKAIDIEQVKRNFDPYEQFLFYTTNSIAYTSSVYYTETGTEYNVSAAWPKQSTGTLYPTTHTSASAWYSAQTAIAERFDEFNVNYLVKHLPEHIQEDSNSIEFLTLVAMFGHCMDNIKVYVDQFPHIYSTSADPLEELSMDQVYEVAKSIGLQLPNAYAIEQLNKFVEESVSSNARISVAETWKRMLHSAIYLTKAKGTRRAIDGVLNVYGINSPTIQLKETAYPSPTEFIQSDELVYGLKFTSSIAQRVAMPFVSSSMTASTIQLRFLPTTRASSSLLTGDSRWALNIVPHPSSSIFEEGALVSQSNGRYNLTSNANIFGRVEVVSGSNMVRIASSSYFPMFTDDYTNIMFTSMSSQLTIIQTDGDQLLHIETVPLSLGTMWNATRLLHLGGSGSMKSNINFAGTVDEVRVWGEEISATQFVKQAYDPGSLYGASYTSSYVTLYTDLAFSQPLPSITSSATNESPYVSASAFSIPAVGFTTASYTKGTRTIKQFVPMSGATVYSNNKVAVAPPPVFSEASLDENSVYVLSRTNSIKPLRDKQFIGGQDTVMFSVSPVDFINQVIMRTMGVVNINYLIGSPRKLRNGKYSEVDTLYKFYLEHYNKSINPNEYIRFYKNAIKGPTDQVRDMIPSRARLIDGVVIESPVLHRTKNYIAKSIKVDGSNTTTHFRFMNSASSAQTSSLVGAYALEATYELYPQVDNSIVHAPDVVYQYINPHTLVTSSLISDGNGIAFIDATVELVRPIATGSYDYYEGEIFRQPSVVTQSGYPRVPYVGIPAVGSQGNSWNVLGDSEVNTLVPFYSIHPTADFVDVGTTTYFHLTSGIYKFPSRISRYTKEWYKAQFDRAQLQLHIPPITLLSTSSFTYPDRGIETIASTTYVAGANAQTTIRIARVFSILAIDAPAGMQIDISRLDGTLVFSALLDGVADINPIVTVNAGTAEDVLQCTITNTTASTITTGVKLHYYAYEQIDSTPKGYLPRHYKFFRNTSVAQRRRNITGCKIIYCPEGCPDGVTQTDVVSPVQITISTNTGVVVNTPNLPNPLDGEVKFGGNGPLDA